MFGVLSPEGIYLAGKVEDMDMLGSVTGGKETFTS